MGVPFLVVDAFASEPFSGNSAGVCLLDEPADSAWMQAVAAELAQPATAFVTADGGLRWFTPSVELEICGHGTLAAAHAVWEAGRDVSSFATPAGTLGVSREDGSIFVALAAGAVEPVEPPPGLLESVGAAVVEVWRTPLDYLLLLDSPDAVVAVRPDHARMGDVETRGVIVTAEGGEADFTTRFFAPALGLPEDQATGSIHASLGPFWAERLGRTALRGRQASRRGATIDARVEGDVVRVGGPAVTVARGELGPLAVTGA